MLSLLLPVIYLAFISLGLPDSILGSAWPTMYGPLGADISWAGGLSMLIAGGTILSSLASDRVIRRFGTGPVTAVSVAMTCAGLFGFSVSRSYLQLCLWCVPYGLGAGSVDAALNNFVALHYKARHMSWLHCFWGIGATAGPAILGLCLAAGGDWRTGYGSIGWIQLGLVALLLFTLPAWKKTAAPAAEAGRSARLTLADTLSLLGAKPVLVSFFCYCALESTAGLWACSWLVLCKEVPAETAAGWGALFYLGITLGRGLSGFITGRLGDSNMVRLGILTALAGAVVISLPVPGAFAAAGLVLIGLGYAPIYPSMLHQTPENFGAKHSQSVMGLQMACAYVGSTFVPPAFGLLAGAGATRLYPAVLLAIAGVMLAATERVRRLHGR